MQLAKDPIILYSYINTMLRDRYASLEDFCTANDIDENMLREQMASAGFTYVESIHQFR